MSYIYSSYKHIFLRKLQASDRQKREVEKVSNSVIRPGIFVFDSAPKSRGFGLVVAVTLVRSIALLSGQLDGGIYIETFPKRGGGGRREGWVGGRGGLFLESVSIEFSSI